MHWPDGKAYIEQENMVVSMFGVIGNEVKLMSKDKKRSTTK